MKEAWNQFVKPLKKTEGEVSRVQRAASCNIRPTEGSFACMGGKSVGAELLKERTSGSAFGLKDFLNMVPFR